MKRIIQVILIVICLASWGFADDIFISAVMDDNQILTILSNVPKKKFSRREFAALEKTAEELVKEKRLNIAKEIYLRLLGTSPSKKRRFNFNMALGDIEMASGYPQRAMQYYNVAQTLYPKNVHALIQEGDLLIAANILDLAQENFQKVLKLDKNSDIAKKRLGDIFFKQNMYVKALEYYQRVRRNAFDRDLLINMLLCYRRLGQPQKVLDLADLHLEFSNEAYVHFIVGLAYFDLENFTQAKQELLLSANLDPENFVPYLYLAQVALRENDLQGAKGFLAKAQNISHSSVASIDFMFAQIYYKQGMLASAKKYAQSAIVKAQDNQSFIAAVCRKLIELIDRGG